MEVILYHILTCYPTHRMGVEGCYTPWFWELVGENLKIVGKSFLQHISPVTQVFVILLPIKLSKNIYCLEC